MTTYRSQSFTSSSSHRRHQERPSTGGDTRKYYNEEDGRNSARDNRRNFSSTDSRNFPSEDSRNYAGDSRNFAGDRGTNSARDRRNYAGENGRTFAGDGNREFAGDNSRNFVAGDRFQNTRSSGLTRTPVDFEATRSALLRSKELYRDVDFPTDERSIGQGLNIRSRIIWKRPHVSKTPSVTYGLFVCIPHSH
jgi:hypothetical protein